MILLTKNRETSYDSIHETLKYCTGSSPGTYACGDTSNGTSQNLLVMCY